MSKLKNNSKNNSQPFIYIIILNWNGLEDTKDCISSLESVNYSNYLIHIIDNGSKDDDFAQLRGLYQDNKKIAVTANSKNLGYAGGCNVGLKASLKSNAKYSLLLNNDTVVDKNLLIDLTEIAEKSESISSVGPKVYYFDHPKKVWEVGKRINFFSPLLSKPVNSSTPTKVDNIVGCCMLLRNNALKKVGLFDEDYFAYSEENDLNYRLKKNKFDIYYQPNASVWHKVSSSTGGEFSPTSAYFITRNKILFAKKNLPFYQLPSYSLYFCLFLFKKFTLLILEKRWSVIRAMLKGVKDGV
jgi:GT2 family glycosyltransferase